MGDDLASRVEHALRASDAVRDVQHVGSRARGNATALSDWDFRISVTDFPTVAAELPELVRPLSPLGEQWDRLSEEQCYMVLLHGPHKVDLIFDEPHVDEPPWRVTPETLQPIDAHFWDWILWLASKREKGQDEVVRRELAKMSVHLLRPLGVDRVPGSIESALESYRSARDEREREFGVEVSRRLEHEVLHALSER